MNTHAVAQQLAFYRAPVPSVGITLQQAEQGIRDFASSTGLDTVFDQAATQGQDALFNALVESVTGQRLSLEQIRALPLHTRRMIVEKAKTIPAGGDALSSFIAERILNTVQDKFFVIAGRYLTPPYIPVRDSQAKSYAQALIELRALPATKRNEIISFCESSDPNVGAFARRVLTVQSSVPSGPSGPSGPSAGGSGSSRTLTAAQIAALTAGQRAALQRLQRSGQTLAKKFRGSEELKKLANQRQAIQNLLERKGAFANLETVPVTPPPQRFTMSRNLKIAAGILGVVIVGGTIYLMSEDA